MSSTKPEGRRRRITLVPGRPGGQRGQGEHVVGWWSPGVKPGSRKGTAILAGHINYATREVIRFTVTGVRTYHTTRLPYRQIFDQRSVGRIAIVTCGGPFDASTGNYLDNIVVFAVPAAARAA